MNDSSNTNVMTADASVNGNRTTDAGDRARPTRRGFLAAGGGAALVIGFHLPGCAQNSPQAAAAAATDAAKPSGPRGSAVFAPNAWLRVGMDDRVTVICGSAEMGQGVHTAIPMMVAEELDADWSKVSVEQAPVDSAYANPAFQMQATGGSTTVRGHWELVRKAGASARAMLVQAAAAKWNVPAAEIKTDAGKVMHGAKTLRYGELVADASKLKPPTDVALKPAAQRRIMGQPLKRLDTPPKVDGSAKYGIDVQLPGMLVAVMARAPLPGVKVGKVDDSKARAVKGVKNVLTIPSGVAVLADGYWAAKLGRDALQVTWDFGDKAGFSTTAASQTMQAAAKAGRGTTARTAGAPDNARPAKVVEAVYEAPFIAHACMEPMNCTAWVQGDKVEVWAGTQSQGPAAGILAQVASVQPGNVKVHTQMLGGGFGRRFAPDVVIDATMLSKAAGGIPVKLVYTREDDMGAGFYRPPGVAAFKGGVDASGKLTMLTGTIATPSIMAASGFMKIPDSGIDEFAVEGINDNPYDAPDQRFVWARTDFAPQIWFWRSVGHSQNSFFMESFVDELALAAGKDPFEFRRAALSKSPRHKAVLELAAEKAGWSKPLPAGMHRGIAVVSSFGSYVAEVAEVSVAADGKPKVHRVVAAIDCGQTVNPEIIRRQVEGGIVYGLTAALYGKITFKDGRAEQGNFHDYPMLRMSEMPKVEVHIVNSTEGPGGVGEPGTPPIAPAVANAIFAATGKRLRSLPFDTGQLKRV